MTDQEPAADHNSKSTKADTAEHAGSSKAAEGTMANDNNQHVVRIVGTYSLFTFFKKEAQSRFFKIITSPEYEETFKPRSAYRTDAKSFCLDKEEEEFELRMTNMGFIREGFWREAFPPIFKLTDAKVGDLPDCTDEQLAQIVRNTCTDKHDKEKFYQFCLERLDKELRSVGGQHEVHISLNNFGIVNIGITIKWASNANQSFEDLCKKAYTNVCHLQEDPLQDFTKLYGESDGIVTTLGKREEPRLLVSYFQVLAITTIHRFLHDKLVDKAIGGFKKEWLANPWELSNKIPESTRHGLPPLRHVVFMYQLVHSISNKKSFLGDNRRALLTLGHNVGWSPSSTPPFPLFDSRRAKLPDSSLLETSCCLVFPQGLVVVIPPDPDTANEKFQTMYLGGNSDNCSSVTVTYRDYWKLIFKLFIRVAEARLLIGMVNRHLTDLHKKFLERRRSLLSRCTGWGLYEIHSQLIDVGLIIQRTSGRVITPEVTRYSFVRRKLTDFLETVNFEEHRGYIQSEFEKLNEWVGAIITAFVAYVAIVVALGIGALQIFQNSSGKQSPDCPSLQVAESAKDLRRETDNLKTTTSGLNSEMRNLQGKIKALGKDLETVKRCQHHN
ncbi:MAG: hypothetical protein GDA68_05665 [Nitrospira sp. CR2.1]|nr:hypothetical protein [Nitrospira sp. CR2.1]